jgi:hypothetical protein
MVPSCVDLRVADAISNERLFVQRRESAMHRSCEVDDPSRTFDVYVRVGIWGYVERTCNCRDGRINRNVDQLCLSLIDDRNYNLVVRWSTTVCACCVVHRRISSVYP